jgi:hypothetical protein
MRSLFQLNVKLLHYAFYTLSTVLVTGTTLAEASQLHKTCELY